MSKRSERRRRLKQRKAQPKPPKPQLPPTNPTSKKTTQFWTFLGLAIGVIGLLSLIQLFPRLSSVANPPTDRDDPLLSSRFVVSNDGYTKVTDVMAACFLWRARMTEGGQGYTTAEDTLFQVVRPPENNLRPTEALTVPCTPIRLAVAPAPFRPPLLAKADLAIVVYYRVWPFTFYRDHRLFRFVANTQKNGEVIWEKQPAESLETDYDRFIANHGGTFPPAIH
jgi:hypothetical protein